MHELIVINTCLLPIVLCQSINIDISISEEEDKTITTRNTTSQVYKADEDNFENNLKSKDGIDSCDNRTVDVGTDLNFGENNMVKQKVDIPCIVK